MSPRRQDLLAGPASAVLRAFGAHGSPLRLPGGGGLSWRVGATVLKAVDDEDEAAWLAQFAARLPQQGFRVALPVASHQGAWVVDGWSAWSWLEGEPSATRWVDLLGAAAAFHSAARSLPRPSFIDRRGWSMARPLDRWRCADRIVWDEAGMGDLGRVARVSELMDARRAVVVPSQLVHCDLAGNVLFAPGLSPAIIDLSMYWRPVGYSAAIAIADAVTWEGAPLDTVHLLEPYAEWPQLLVRAVLFRVIVSELARRGRRPERREAYDPIAAIALSACASPARR